MAENKSSAVRMVRTRRGESGIDWGTGRRVALELGLEVESVRSWVRQANVNDGWDPGVPADAAAETQRVEQDLSEIKRSNEIQKRAEIFFGVELGLKLEM